MHKRFTEDSFRREPWFKALCQGLLTIRSEEDMASLLRDVGTLGELQAWSERLEVARQLVKGLSYRQVAALTGASTTTVTRVAKAIENGEGGYRKLLHAHRHHRMIKKIDQQVRSQEAPQQHQDSQVEQKPTLLQKYFSRP